MLTLDGISKTFFPGTVNERTALDDVDLHLEQSEFVTVIGSNGAGKSTLLNVVSGSYRADAGTVTIDGHNVTKLNDHQRARYIGRVFQNPSAGTAPHMTIEENLAMAFERGQRRLLRKGVTRAKRADFREHLAVLEQGLEDRLKDWACRSKVVLNQFWCSGSVIRCSSRWSRYSRQPLNMLGGCLGVV